MYTLNLNNLHEWKFKIIILYFTENWKNAITFENTYNLLIYNITVNISMTPEANILHFSVDLRKGWLLFCMKVKKSQQYTIYIIHVWTILLN